MRSGRAVCNKDLPELQAGEQLLDAADIRYTVRFAEENRDAVRALGIRQAPTLVSGGQKWTGVSRCAGVYCRKGERKCMRF